MFKITVTQRYPIGVYNDLIIHSIESNNNYILKHVEERFYKAFSTTDENIDINDNRGKWKEHEITRKLDLGEWVRT